MTDRALLLSISPEFFAKIASGSKDVELRRRFPNLEMGTTIYLYVTLPVGAVQGSVSVAGIERGSRSKIWSIHGKRVGISRVRFFRYFDGCSEAVAVVVNNFKKIPNFSLTALRMEIPGFAVPQSYRFISLEQQRSILKGEIEFPSR